MKREMTGEVEYFRKRFVGGFNREDVVKYISKLAQERNDWRAAKEKADLDMQALGDRIAALENEIRISEQEVRAAREYKAAELEAAAGIFSQLEAAFGNLCRDLETTTESICTELDQARRTITALPAYLEQAGRGIRELQMICLQERNQPPEALSDAAGGFEGSAE